MNIGLKIGSTDVAYEKAINELWGKNVFQYIELFTVPNTYKDNINFWRQFKIPFGIHAPHSGHGMNPSLKEKRQENAEKIKETIGFANALNAEYIIFHPGIVSCHCNAATRSGLASELLQETAEQLLPFADSRFLIENKPFKALNGNLCLGAQPSEIEFLTNKLKVNFCLDFGHAICAANSLKQEPMSFIKKFLELKPKLFHLTDGIYNSEMDAHLHYGQGDFPICEIAKLLPENARVTNEARHDSQEFLDDFLEDCQCLCNCLKK